MPIEFEYPEIKYGVNPPAVYKMTFDTGHFYYGSSGKVKTRIVLWRTTIRQKSMNSKLIVSLLPIVSKVKFEIVEFSENKDAAIRKETALIKSVWGHPMLLNRCPDGKNHTGFRATDLDKNASPIAIFDSKWNIIERFPSFSALFDKYGICQSTIYSFLKGHQKDIKGYKFKRINEDGSFLEPIAYHAKKCKTKKVKGLIKGRSRVVIDTETGTCYSSVTELASILGCNHFTLRSKMNGSHRNNTKYKYA